MIQSFDDIMHTFRCFHFRKDHIPNCRFFQHDQIILYNELICTCNVIHFFAVQNDRNISGLNALTQDSRKVIDDHIIVVSRNCVCLYIGVQKEIGNVIAVK